MELKPSFDIADTLRQAQAEKMVVEVHLPGGQSFKGTVLGVGDHSVIIGPLQGMDFFDAQVRLEHISAISLQTRGR